MFLRRYMTVLQHQINIWWAFSVWLDIITSCIISVCLWEFNGENHHMREDLTRTRTHSVWNSPDTFRPIRCDSTMEHWSQSPVQLGARCCKCMYFVASSYNIFLEFDIGKVSYSAPLSELFKIINLFITIVHRSSESNMHLHVPCCHKKIVTYACVNLQEHQRTLKIVSLLTNFENW